MSSVFDAPGSRPKATVRSQTLSGSIAMAAGIALSAFAAPAIASDAGMAAADQVSEVSYYNFMDEWLYTHNGDNRGVGLL